eukprot:TRINITY_DN383_c0_g1_i3.p1 TRINITY_DN383_c0_g1~~TRINITY_DN383_c0_g1_i3.p1  ORF type:complete len:228 (+),score=53.16 TRINITY_DN383_c0_g1_i3:66-686(+)
MTSIDLPNRDGYDDLDREQQEKEEQAWIPFAEEDDPLPGQLSPFASTMLATIKSLFELAEATSDDFILDLGCGDGRIVTFAAEALGCKGIGVDINPDLIEKAKEFAKERGVSHLVEFRVADFADPSFRINPATIITTYLLPKALKVIEGLFAVLDMLYPHRVSPKFVTDYHQQLFIFILVGRLKSYVRGADPNDTPPEVRISLFTP